MMKTSAIRFGVAAVAAAGMIGFNANETDAATELLLSFSRITDNADAAINAENNFLLSVSDQGDRVRFRLDNNDVTAGLTNAVVTRIFIQDLQNIFLPEIGDFNAASHYDAASGVNFGNPDTGGNLSNLPGGNSVGFDVSFGMAADNPGPSNGINFWEWAYFDLKLADGKTFADVQANFLGDLSLGIHVTSIQDGESDWSDAFVTTNIVPLPAAAWGGLALFGMLGVGQRLRRRRMIEAV
ncbi:hypothetical protein ACERK3_06030 [Phycisphaerales bacterium AB-hyl4]|uniref:VPLPA-CTERM protein sorting domain-containing protein n=1 Tax=Natronomicrosphaera hydrolytica TaxID=3242702 RepID=A0ABV4U4T9_9BACT